MSLDCLNETIRFGNATLRSVEENQSFIDWFISICVLSTSLLANGWLLAVSWGTAYIDGIFKYPVCYLAFCDALLAVGRIAQSTFHLFANPSTYVHYTAVPYALIIPAGNAMFLALIPTPLQRCLFFVDVPSLSDHARQPRSIIEFCAVLFVLSVVPSIGSILAPPDGCLNSSFYPQLPVNWLALVVTRSIFVLSYVAAMVAVSLFVWKVKQMRSLTDQLAAGANVAQPSSEVNMDRDILAMAVVQTVNPLLLTAPAMIIGAGWVFGFEADPLVLLIAIGVFQLNPLMDALSTIYYIKPYRRRALKTAKRIRQILCKPNTVNLTPAVVVNVSPAAGSPGNVDNMHVSFTASASIQRS